MENKQTAVEWFAEQIIRKHPIITQFLPNYNFDKEIIEQSKQIKREQSEQICLTVFERILDKMEKGETVKSKDIFEQYYNQTYGK